MVRKLAIAACGLMAANGQQIPEEAEIITDDAKLSPNLMTTLKSADKYERVSTKGTSKASPLVGMKTYLFDDFEDIKKDFVTLGDWGSVGYEVDYHADLFAAFEMPTFWMLRQGTNWMIYNPNVFIEAAGMGAGTIKLSVIELTIHVNVMLGKYTPWDFQMAWDLDNKSRMCYSMGWFWEVFDLEVTTEWNINECSVGLLGYLANTLNLVSNTSWKDCAYRRYVPR